MSQITTCYSNAYTAWEKWYLTDFDERNQALTRLKTRLPDELKNAFNYQLKHSGSVVAETQSLPGPTGETNELYAQGRGVSVLLADSKQENTRKAVSAMLAALLAAGNSVIVCTDDSAVTDLISTLSQSAILPQGVLQFIAKESYSELLQQDIRNFAFIGEKQTTHELNKMLATRPYTITTLVAETDLQSLPYSRDPMLVLRFITERVRTINITAIGGNAMLLELSNDNH